MYAWISTLFVLVIGEVSPPSDFSTDCKYVYASSTADDDTIVVPLDVCYQHHFIKGEFFDIKSSFKWRCSFDDAANATIPKLYTYGDTLCSLQESASGLYTPLEYNCNSQTACPYTAFSVTQKTSSSCGTSGGNSSFTQDDTYFFRPALNLCNKKNQSGTVFTCNESRIYQWTYNDSECTEYASYEIYQETGTVCQGTTEISDVVSVCDMKDVHDPFTPTPPPTENPTQAPHDATGAPTAAPLSPSATSTQSPATAPNDQGGDDDDDDDSAAYFMSSVQSVVHLVALSACIFTVIQ